MSSVTIMKYQAKDGKYYFIVKDKFDIADEVERLDYMMKLSLQHHLGKGRRS